MLIWPTAVIVFGLGLTAALVVLIVFALVRLIGLATPESQAKPQSN